MNIITPPTDAEITSSTSGCAKPASVMTQPINTSTHTTAKYSVLSLAWRAYAVFTTSATIRDVQSTMPSAAGNSENAPTTQKNVPNQPPTAALSWSPSTCRKPMSLDTSSRP